MNNKFFLVPFLCLASMNGQAGTMGKADELSQNVLTLSGGPTFASSSQSQVIYIEPDLFYGYQADKKDTHFATGELFYGIQKPLNQTFLGQLGVAVAASTAVRASGSVWNDADPEFDNFFYNYKVHHYHVALKGKLLANTPFWAQPYVSGSLGVGFNHAHNFRYTPKIFEQIPPPAFESHTQTNFIYTAGVGLQKAIRDNWSFGVGYEFAAWGKSNFSRSVTQTANSGLKLNHLYAHQLQFSLSFNI